MPSASERLQHTQAQRLLRAGIALFLIGLLTGLAVPAMGNPRMGLASHVEALMNGTFLVVLGLVWPRLILSPTQLAIAFWLARFHDCGVPDGALLARNTPRDWQRRPVLLLRD